MALISQGYHVYELANVTITSYNVSSIGSGQDPPTEVVTVHFDEIEATYSEAETEWQKTEDRASPPAHTYTPRPR